MPNQIADYVHRIGRTGRAGRTGVSYTYFSPTDNGSASRDAFALRLRRSATADDLLTCADAASELARDLMDLLVKAKQEVPPQLRELVCVVALRELG